MRFLKPESRHIVIASAAVLSMVAVAGIVPWFFVSATASAADQADPKETKVAKKDRTERGWFVSFEDGLLELQYFEGAKGPVEKTIQIPDSATTFVWNHDERRLKPVDTAQAMSQLKALVAPVSASHVDTAETMMWRKAGTGLVVQIAAENVTIRIGENRIPPFVGNFVSFKDDFLFSLLKNTDPKFQKTYGDTVKFRMNEGIPVYESIDGGEYQRVGTPRTVLAKMKEGTIVTVFHNYKTETDEFYLILAGVKKK